jgi:hypothetical protein
MAAVFIACRDFAGGCGMEVACRYSELFRSTALTPSPLPEGEG